MGRSKKLQEFDKMLSETGNALTKDFEKIRQDKKLLISKDKENVEKYNKHIGIIKKLDSQRETILQANNDGKLMNEETKSEYEELKRKKNDIIERDKKLAKLHEQYLDEYNSIIKKKEDIKEELEKINAKSRSCYNKK